MFSHRFVSVYRCCSHAWTRSAYNAAALLCRVAYQSIVFRFGVSLQAESSALLAGVFVYVFLLRKWPPSCLWIASVQSSRDKKKISAVAVARSAFIPFTIPATEPHPEPVQFSIYKAVLRRSILGTLAKLRKATLSFITGLYFCPSFHMKHLHSHWIRFSWNLIFRFFFPKIFREDTVFIQSTRITGTLHEEQFTIFFKIISSLTFRHQALCI